ncbi:c-type cytochrome [Luteimonas sp. SJ-92]|uniref:C-type cytochrome n=2 Tax=Luteimonas salinisoli TaxID=2752307 RepID=A0A853JH06_9GAMM|nr:c-type cytochrome [Luteimonas salinisoli]NZA28034.1 c-type cytochrome [Luteimonas salinisoli]
MTDRKSRKPLPLLCLIAACAVLTACGGGQDDGAEQRSSSAGLPKGRIDAGERQANAKGAATGQSCIDCHGADGNEPLDPTYPKLGGQYADYLGHALQQYRNGNREHALMANQAQDLNDQQIADLAAYFASRPAQIRDLQGAH